MRRTRERRDRGSALVLVTVIGAMLLILVGVLVDSSLSGSRAATATYNHSAAHLAAMSGLWSACNSLSQARTGNTTGSLRTGAWAPDTGDDLDGDEFVDFRSDATFLGAGDGYFESRTRLMGTSGYVVRARGVHGGVFRTIEAAVVPTGYTAAKPFSRALFASHDLTIGGSSSIDGSVASNEKIFLTGTVSVLGAANPGPKSTISVGSGCLVTGSTAALSAQEGYYPPLWTVPPPTDPLVNTTALGVLYDQPFAAASGTRTLDPGKYVVSSLALSGTAIIEAQGGPNDVVEIYVTGGAAYGDAASFSLRDESQFRIAANGPTVKIYNVGKLKAAATSTLNQTGSLPAQLQYFSLYASDNSSDMGIDLGSASDLAGVFYAPQAHVDIAATTTVRGSVIGRRVDVGGTASFFYDAALKDLTLPYAGKTLFVPTATYELP